MAATLDRLRSDRDAVLRQLEEFAKREIVPALADCEEAALTARLVSMLDRLRRLNTEIDRLVFQAVNKTKKREQ